VNYVNCWVNTYFLVLLIHRVRKKAYSDVPETKTQKKGICLVVKLKVLRRLEAGSVKLMWMLTATTTIRTIIKKNAGK
jgi:hypothetical protein